MRFCQFLAELYHQEFETYNYTAHHIPFCTFVLYLVKTCSLTTRRRTALVTPWYCWSGPTRHCGDRMVSTCILWTKVYRELELDDAWLSYSKRVTFFWVTVYFCPFLLNIADCVSSVTRSTDQTYGFHTGHKPSIIPYISTYISVELPGCNGLMHTMLYKTVPTCNQRRHFGICISTRTSFTAAFTY